VLGVVVRGGEEGGGGSLVEDGAGCGGGEVGAGEGEGGPHCVCFYHMFGGGLMLIEMVMRCDRLY